MGVPARRGSNSRKCSFADAPIYRPTASEFADPLAYIACIRPDAERYGICQIVVPPELVPVSSLLEQDFSFQTRIQKVCELQQRSDSASYEVEFAAAFNAFIKAEGKPAPKPSYTVCGVDVPLWRLYKLVSRRGGYSNVTGDKAWREVARVLKVSLRCRRRQNAGCGLWHV